MKHIKSYVYECFSVDGTDYQRIDGIWKCKDDEGEWVRCDRSIMNKLEADYKNSQR